MEFFIGTVTLAARKERGTLNEEEYIVHKKEVI